MNSLLNSSWLGTFVIFVVVFGTCWRAYNWSRKSKQGYGLKTFSLTENDALVLPKKASAAEKQSLIFFSKLLSIFAILFILTSIYFVLKSYFYDK